MVCGKREVLEEGGNPRLSPAITRSVEWQEMVRSHYSDLVKDGGSPWFHLAAFKQACRVAASEAKKANAKSVNRIAGY